MFQFARLGVTSIFVAGAGALLAVASAKAQTASTEPALKLCVDPPPHMVYWKLNPAGERTGELAGATVDLMVKAFERIGRRVRFVVAPWARCLFWAETGEVAFAVGGYYDSERAKRFAFSTPFRTLTPTIYSLRRNPVRPNTLEELRHFRGCGLIGFSYRHYGLEADELDLGPAGKDPSALLHKLRTERCDYVLEEQEIMDEWAALEHADYNMKDVLAWPARWAAPPRWHLLAGRGQAAAALLEQVNPILSQLAADGTAAALWREYGGSSTYRP
jgi:ABC-type amino acid transport substrate-binding protein